MSQPPDPGRLPARGSPEDATLLDRHFLRALENVAMIALALDPDGRITFANDHLLALTGWSRDEVLGQDWFTMFVPDAGRIRGEFEAGLASGALPERFENEIVTRRGERHLIAWSNHVLHDEAGRPEGTVSLGQDVGDERKAAALLRSREELFRSLIEHLSDVIAILAPDGTVLYASPSVERLLGWKPEELVGTPSFALVHGDDLTGVEQAFGAIVEGDEPGAMEFRLRNRDGTWRTVEGIGRRRLQDGEWVVVATYRDVTDQRHLREQLTHAQKLEAVGRLAGGIAHDFNNLLTAIAGYSEFLAGTFDAGDPRRDDALEIVRASERATALTGQLLTFSRRQVLRQEVLDLGEVTVSLEKLLSRLLGADVALETTVEAGCHVTADRSQLEQVITNLAVNARDAMPAGGKLEITVRRTTDRVELLVGDSGSGMDRETLSHIFEPFFTTKEAGKGTGLGLATVYGIVTQSGGEISVTSSPGEGTCFRIQLPMAAADVAESEPAEEAAPAAGSECILLAEDEETIRRLVTEVLTRNGYRVLAAAAGNEALELLERPGVAVDLLLTDVVMPGMSGPDLARAARRHSPGLRVLYMSGYTSEPDEAFEDPDVDFIGKPFSPQALVAKVRDVLDAG